MDEVEEVEFSFIKQKLLEDQNRANKNSCPEAPDSAKIWTGKIAKFAAKITC